MKRIEETTDLETCLALRRLVFIDEQGVSEADELDDLDDEAIHLLASENDFAVGTARLVPQGRTLKIGRVCVLKTHRNKGLGAAIIRRALDIAELDARFDREMLGAQTHALGFYEALGFTAFGPVYDDAGIPHRDMEKSV